MRDILIIISISLLISCARSKTNAVEKNSSVNATRPRFTEFLDSIPNHPLPIKLNCGLPDGVKSSTAFRRFKEYIPTSVDRIFGTIGSSNSNYRLIIFGQTGDEIYPVLFSFDSNGKIKDSLSLMLANCGAADENQIPSSSALIGENLTITLTDTTRLIHYPENPSSVEVYVVDSVRVSRIVVRIDSFGKFIRR